MGTITATCARNDECQIQILTHKAGLAEVPGTEDASQQVVTQPLGGLGKRVCRHRCHNEHICPFAQLDVHNGITLAFPFPPIVCVTCMTKISTVTLLLQPAAAGR